MKTNTRMKWAGLAAVAVVAAWILFAAPAGAQSGPGPLPTVPGADRAANGGMTQAHASLPGEPGRSPLEPYLVTWLLPASGLLAVFAGIYADRRTQAKRPRRRV